MPYVQLCRVTVTIAQFGLTYARVYITIPTRNPKGAINYSNISNPQQVLPSEAKRNGMKLCATMGVHPSTPQIPCFTVFIEETWREKIRKAEARAADLEKEGMLGSNLK